MQGPLRACWPMVPSITRMASWGLTTSESSSISLRRSFSSYASCSVEYDNILFLEFFKPFLQGPRRPVLGVTVDVDILASVYCLSCSKAAGLHVSVQTTPTVKPSCRCLVLTDGGCFTAPEVQGTVSAGLLIYAEFLGLHQPASPFPRTLSHDMPWCYSVSSQGPCSHRL